MIKKVKQCVALLPLLLLLGCPDIEPLDIMDSKFPPIAMTDTTNFLVSSENNRIYAFDTATDKIIGMYVFFDTFDGVSCIRLPNSPYLYFANDDREVDRIDVKTGVSKKLSVNSQLLGRYSSTEILVYNDMYLGESPSSDFSKIDDKTGKFTDLPDQDYINYEAGFMLSDGKDYLIVDDKIRRLSDNKDFAVGEDKVSDLYKNSEYSRDGSYIRKNVIGVEYSRPESNSSRQSSVSYSSDISPQARERKVAVFIYPTPTADIELPDSNYIGDFPAGTSFEYIGNYLYAMGNQMIEKYDITTKKSEGKLEFTSGEFASGVDLENTVVVGTSLYCSLGYIEKTFQDMIVKVNLTDFSTKVISYKDTRGE